LPGCLFQQVAPGHFIQEIHEVQRQHPGTVELPAEQPVLEDGKMQSSGGGGKALSGGGDLEKKR
jgi:hypothetical protein